MEKKSINIIYLPTFFLHVNCIILREEKKLFFFYIQNFNKKNIFIKILNYFSLNE